MAVSGGRVWVPEETPVAPYGSVENVNASLDRVITYVMKTLVSVVAFGIMFLCFRVVESIGLK